MNVHENALYRAYRRVCTTREIRECARVFIYSRPCIHLFAPGVSRWTIRAARADDNCAKSFGQAQQQMVIDKAINHSFRSRELYWPLQALRVVLINVKPDVNVTAEALRRHNSFLPKRAPHRARFNDNDDTLMRGHLYRGRFDHTLIFAFPITGISHRYFLIRSTFSRKFLLHYFFQ